MSDEARVLRVADEEPEPPRKICHPYGSMCSIVPVDDPQTFRGSNIVMPEETAAEAQRRRKRELQGTEERAEIRESKMRHSRVTAVGPDCKRAVVGRLIRWVGGPAAFYLNGEEVCLIQDEQIICWIEEPTEAPKVLQ